MGWILGCGRTVLYRIGNSRTPPMTTTIEQLKKEAREKWLKRVDDDSNDKTGGWSFVMFDEDANNIADWWLKQLAHVHNSAIRSALESLPPELPIFTEDGKGYVDNLVVNGTRNKFRTETEKKLQSLLVNE